AQARKVKQWRGGAGWLHDGHSMLCWAVIRGKGCAMSRTVCKWPMLCAAMLGMLALVPPAAAQPAPAGNKPDVALGSTPDTVVWGYFSARVPPVLRIKSGTTVRIDTMSHQGLVTNDDPVTYFGKAGIKPEEVLQD